MNFRLLSVRLGYIGLRETLSALGCGLCFLLRRGFNFLILESWKGIFSGISGSDSALGGDRFFLTLLCGLFGRLPRDAWKADGGLGGLGRPLRLEVVLVVIFGIVAGGSLFRLHRDLFLLLNLACVVERLLPFVLVTFSRGQSGV
jgi:hypothetical protein